jgi:hypothetical protein
VLLVELELRQSKHDNSANIRRHDLVDLRCADGCKCRHDTQDNAYKLTYASPPPPTHTHDVYVIVRVAKLTFPKFPLVRR